MVTNRAAYLYSYDTFLPNSEKEQYHLHMPSYQASSCGIQVVYRILLFLPALEPLAKHPSSMSTPFTALRSQRNLSGAIDMYTLH